MPNPIYWVGPLCDILEQEERLDVSVKLLDYNNDTGIEFEILKKFFPVIVDSVKNSSMPYHTDLFDLLNVKMLLLIGIVIGAGFEITWNSRIKLLLYDEVIDIYTANDQSIKIKDLLVGKFSLQEVSFLDQP